MGKLQLFYYNILNCVVQSKFSRAAQQCRVRALILGGFWRWQIGPRPLSEGHAFAGGFRRHTIRALCAPPPSKDFEINGDLPPPPSICNVPQSLSVASIKALVCRKRFCSSPNYIYFFFVAKCLEVFLQFFGLSFSLWVPDCEWWIKVLYSFFLLRVS